MTAQASDKNAIQTYRKMLDVLQCFSTVNRQLSLSQIADATALPRTTAHRILNALRDIGFIEQDARGGSYALGIGLFELGSMAVANMDLHREAKPFMDRLARLSEQVVHLGLFNGLEIVVIEREDLLNRKSASLQPNEAAPAYCTGVGKAVLAFQDKAVVERVIGAGLHSFTRNTITSPMALVRELAKIRKRGVAIDDTEHQVGVRCIAAPIRNASARVFAAISVTGPPSRITAEREPLLAELVVQAADSISRQLGYLPS